MKRLCISGSCTDYVSALLTDPHRSRITAMYPKFRFAAGPQTPPKRNKSPLLEPLPQALTSRIPTEIFEHILSQIHASSERNSLSACSLVCRSWFPKSRHLLFGSLIVVPVTLSRWGSLKVKAAVSIRKLTLTYLCIYAFLT